MSLSAFVGKERLRQCSGIMFVQFPLEFIGLVVLFVSRTHAPQDDRVNVVEVEAVFM